MTEMYVLTGRMCSPHKFIPEIGTPPYAIKVKAFVISQKQQDIPVLFCVV